METKIYDGATAVVQIQLNYLRAVRVQRYRPAKARTVLQVDRSVPAWVSKVDVHTINDFAQIRPINMRSQDLDKPTLEKIVGTVTVAQFGCAYDLFDLELERAEQTGINIANYRVLANQTAAEQLVDQIAATGDPFGIGLVGLGNNASVPTATAKTKAAGGLLWINNATALEMVADMTFLMLSVEVNSKENYTADTICLPQLRANELRTKREPMSQRTAMEIFQASYPGVRVITWDRLAAAGAGGTARMVAFNSQAEEVARLVILKELTDSQPVRKNFSLEIGQEMRTAGVIMDNPVGACYMDAF